MNFIIIGCIILIFVDVIVFLTNDEFRCKNIITKIIWTVIWLLMAVQGFVLGIFVSLPLIPGIFVYNWLSANHYHDPGVFVLTISIFLQVVAVVISLFVISGDSRGGGGGGSHQPPGTKTIYDKEGNVKGYIEK